MQYGIVQKIDIEILKKLIKAYLSIEELNLIIEKEDTESLKNLKNKERIKIAEKKREKAKLKTETKKEEENIECNSEFLEEEV